MEETLNLVLKLWPIIVASVAIVGLFIKQRSDLDHLKEELKSFKLSKNQSETLMWQELKDISKSLSRVEGKLSKGDS